MAAKQLGQIFLGSWPQYTPAFYLDRTKPMRPIKLLLVICVGLTAVSCTPGAKTKEELFGEYRAEDRRFEARLYLKRDMTYEQVVTFSDGTKKTFTGRWQFIEATHDIHLPSVYDISDVEIDGEFLSTERIFGRLTIVVNEDQGAYYRKVESY
jgi:hypothetical protein